ncbi:4-alpha-glucanotransferase [Kordiimonas sp.]|uniref:4-alpha-glucanotransferase n=1 Tax=Kordiimonas sp. TaxID=1970157 RepID=UPI003A8E4BB6
MAIDTILLDKLCTARGILDGYHDLSGTYIKASDETKRAQLEAMHIPASSNEDLHSALQEIENERHRLLPRSIVVKRQPSLQLHLQSGVPAHLEWKLTLEDGTHRNGRIDGEETTLELGPDIPLGYHVLELQTQEKNETSHLIVTPQRALGLSNTTAQDKIWGVTAPLYGLTSARNWGIGDFEDLAVFAEGAAAQGADFVGINPVHALFPTVPEIYSPYSPSSREFLNIMHIAPDRIPEFHTSREGREQLATLMNGEIFQNVRAAELVDYPAIYALKTTAFELAYTLFNESAPPERHTAFQAFVTEKGNALQRHALFDVLAEVQQNATPDMEGWSGWPAELQSPDSVASVAARKKYSGRINYYCYLQWVAHEQLNAAQQRSRAAGMAVGLYLDLAVGMVPGGAEAWGEPDAVVHGISLGAPGDPANPDGQKWHLAPLDPTNLSRSGFRIFRRTLREIMRPAGLVRIDHILGLNRAFWCPLESETNGNYVVYPREDMLGVIALESIRNNCVVVGEDLGTVPEGFRERLAEWGLLGCAVLYFEREGEAFKAPAHFEKAKLASINNHDFPTLKGYWEEEDFRWREALGIGTDGDRIKRDKDARLHDRWLMLKRLEAENLLPNGVSPNAAPAQLSDDLSVAVHAYLARTEAAVITVQVEDLLGLRDQANVPGTTTEEPNWRRKLPSPVESIFKGELASRILTAIRSERPQI